MHQFLDVFKSTGWTASLPVGILLVIQAALLLFTDKIEEVTLTARQRLVRKVIKVVVFSVVCTFILALYFILFDPTEIEGKFIEFLIFAITFDVSLLTLGLWFLDWKNKTFFYIHFENKEIMFIQPMTLDNKILLTSIKDTKGKENGYAVFITPEKLSEHKIYFYNRRTTWYLKPIRFNIMTDLVQPPVNTTQHTPNPPVPQP